jgi:hypothetical protein
VGTAVTCQNYIYEDVISRLISGNASYHLVQNLLSFCLPSKNLNIIIDKTITLSDVSWNDSLRENEQLRKTYAPTKEGSNRIMERIA